MSYSIINMIGDIKSGRPVRIVKKMVPTPRHQIMYGRKGAPITMGQHLDEFDSYRDSESRAFDQVLTDGLLAESNNLMHPPPKPQVAKPAPKPFVDDDDDETFMNKLYAKEAARCFVQLPRYTEQLEKAAVKGLIKSKAGDMSEIQAQNIKVLGGGFADTQGTTQNDNARKRPRTHAYFKA